MTELAATRRLCGEPKVGNGQPCQGLATAPDGYCPAHSRVMTFGSPEQARQAAMKSAETRRALANSARERLRQIADQDHATWAQIKANLAGALEATDPDGNPDWRVRLEAQKQLLAEAYGKPVQPTREENPAGVTIITAPLDELPPSGIEHT